jgi:thymidylate synthase (FAD)
MEVEVLRATEQPERLVCQAARGDYFEGYVGDTEYAELMKNVDYDENNMLRAADKLWGENKDRTIDDLDVESNILQTAARTNSFIEKQLSRGHYGPWEHPQITFAVKGVSRVTMAQITRHRHMTFDIQSMRYADFSEQEIVTPKSLTDEDHFTREMGEVDLSEYGREKLKELYENHVESSVDAYQNMVDAGVPKEDARFILPLGTTVNMTFSGNARTFMHVFNLRQKASSQWEIRELSDMLAEELKSWMPYSFNWYDDNKPHKIGP